MLKVLIVLLGVMISVSAMAQELGLPEAEMAALRVRVADERARIEELQLLRIEVERLKLELEKKKTASELSRIQGVVDGQGISSDAQPAVVVRYVLIAGARREAVFDVNGVEERVREGGRVLGQVVKIISADGVVLKDPDGHEQVLSVIK